tara:strand:+ start:300 stop:560 length:261 start_codon:yes stop_codon:yes gene_type:complete
MRNLKKSQEYPGCRDNSKTLFHSVGTDLPGTTSLKGYHVITLNGQIEFSLNVDTNEELKIVDDRFNEIEEELQLTRIDVSTVNINR